MLAGRVGLVTGSTSGIGLGIASCLAREGCIVVLHGSREESAAQNAINHIKNSYEGAEVFYVQASLASPEDAAKTLVEKTMNKYSRLDIIGE